MTAVDVDALDKLREAATAGPWEDEGGATGISAYTSDADAALIVAAVNALPDLIAEARKYRTLREAVEGLADELDVPAGVWSPLTGLSGRIRAALAAVEKS